MTQICDALDAAHHKGIIHRDLKPSNVLIEGVWNKERSEGEEAPPQSFLKNLKVRVVDFGLAKIVAGDTTGTVLTEQDMVFGTPDYMAPEQVAGEELDRRCDIYAAGVMLYEMIVGAVPYDTPGPLTTMTAHLRDPIPVPSERAPDRDIPASLDRCIMRALSKEPADRFATAKELAEALGSLEEDPPATVPAGSGRRRRQRRIRRRHPARACRDRHWDHAALAQGRSDRRHIAVRRRQSARRRAQRAAGIGAIRSANASSSRAPKSVRAPMSAASGSSPRRS